MLNTAMRRAFAAANPSKYDEAVKEALRVEDHYPSPEEFKKALEQAHMACTSGRMMDMLFSLEDRFEKHGMKAYLPSTTASILKRLADEGDMIEQMYPN